MESKKFLFVLSHATSNPMEVIVMLKIISNMKAFDDEADIAVFLVGEGVELRKRSGENHDHGTGRQSGQCRRSCWT